MQRLPIFHDDQSFRDRTERLFRDMQLQMDQDLIRGLGTGVSRWPLLQDAHGGRMGDDYFFQLKPRPVDSPMHQGSSSLGIGREVLDEATVKNLFVEGPDRQSRVFRMSFDVNSYDPKDVQVRVEDRCLVVEAKHNDVKDGSKYTKEFCRKIQLPAEVEAEKLTSTLSTDGILSIQAPVPPTYQDLSLTAASSLPDPTLLLGSGQFSVPVRSSPITIQQQQTCQPPQKVSSIAVQQLGFPTSSSSPSSTLQYQQQQQQQLRPVALGGAVTIPVIPYPTGVNVGLDRPAFTTVEGGRRRMDLVLELGRQYRAQDVVVKIDGKRLVVEATHETNEHGRISKSSMQREFDLAEDVDPGSVQAMMKVEGQLAIVAFVRQ